MFMGKTLYSHSALLHPGVFNNMVPANLMLGLSLWCTSIEGRRNAPTVVHFTLLKLEIIAGLTGHLAHN